jgi:hypothetical protein
MEPDSSLDFVVEDCQKSSPGVICPRSLAHVPQFPSRPLAQTALGWRAAATRLRSGGDDILRRSRGEYVNGVLDR